VKKLPIQKGGYGSGRKKTKFDEDISSLRKDAEGYRDTRDYYEKRWNKYKTPTDKQAIQEYKDKIDATELKIHNLQEKQKGRSKEYTWGHINEKLTNAGLSPKRISTFAHYIVKETKKPIRGDDFKISWDDINIALTNAGVSPKKISDILIYLNK